MSHTLIHDVWDGVSAPVWAILTGGITAFVASDVTLLQKSVCLGLWCVILPDCSGTSRLAGEETIEARWFYEPYAINHQRMSAWVAHRAGL